MDEKQLQKALDYFTEEVKWLEHLQSIGSSDDIRLHSCKVALELIAQSLMCELMCGKVEEDD